MKIMDWLKSRLFGPSDADIAYQAVLASSHQLRSQIGELKERLEPIANARDPFLALWSLRDLKMAALAHEINEEQHFHWGDKRP